MAKFLENTSDINRSIKKKKKKQETVAKPQSPSAPKQQRAQQAQNQKTYGGMPQPQQQTVKRPSTSSSKSTSKNVSRNVSQQTQRTVDRLQQKYGTNNQSRTQPRTASRPQTQTKRYQPHTAERLSERREQIRSDRNRASSNQATLDRLQDRYGRNKGHNRWNEELKPEQAETAKDRLKEKFETGKVRGGEETKLDEAGRVTKRIGKAFGQGAELAVTEDRKLLNKFSNPSTSNKFYNRELNPEDMEKNKKKLALRDEGLRQKILKQQEDMSKLEAQGGSYLERMAIQGAQSAGGMAVDALAGPMSLVHMGARVAEGSYVSEEEKVRKLRQRVEESGQYTPEEIDEMFKDMDKRIMASALSEAAIEVLTEKMFGGIGMASKVVGGKGFLDAAASKLTGRLGSSVAGRMLRGTAEEIAEEEIGNPAQAAMSNIIMNNRLNEINQDVTRRGIEAQSTDLISRIGSEEDARAVAANLNSESFLDEAAAGFRESGASKKEAQELAEMTRDYLYASVTGDTEKAEEIREKMVDKLAGEEQYKEKWTLQDAIDVAVSTGLMTAATGAPGAITSAAVGANYKSEKGVQGVKKLAELTKSLDPEKSARAQAVIDRIDSGKDVSNSQVYEIMSWSQEATAEATKREQAKDSIVRRKMEEEDLLVPASTRASDGSYMLSPKTEDRFEQIADETMEKFEQMSVEDSETELPEDEKYTIADAVAAFQTGTITAEQINELNYDRPAARKVFKEVTGIDLDQYNEKTKAGNINEAASNVRMQEALFARAAENYVESARAEQVHWDNVTRGEYVEQLESNNRMGSEGSKALTTAIKSVDPRDQRKLMRMGAAANSLYERALYSNDSWEDVRAEAAKNFSSLDISALKAVFDSGKADRAIQETAFYGRAVKANEELTKKSLAEAEQVAVPGEVVNKTGRTVTADDLLFLQSVADTLHIKVEAVDIEPRYEGWFTESTGVLTVNLNEGVKKPLRMVVTHELTHSNIYAPDEFMKLLRYIGDAWYKADPAGYKAAIDERKARYKKDQELNDLDALEEIVADGSIDYNFWNDEDLAATLATEDPGLAQKFLNAIRELLRKIRSILADQPAELEDDRVYTSLYADAIDMAEAERLMLNALKAARQVRNENAIEAWDAEARGETAEETSEDAEGTRLSVGYHAGDLGKSTVDDYAHQGYSRGSGHFGFGTYFVGDEEQINYGNYAKRKHETVDFDKYNLFRPRNFEQALKLHDALKLIDGYITEYSDFNQYGRFTLERSERKWDNTRRINDAAEELVSDYEWNDYEWDDSTRENKEKVDKYIADNLDDYDRSELERKARQKYEEAQNRTVDEDEVRSELARNYNVYKDMKDFWGDPFVSESSEEEYIQKHLDSTIRIRTENKNIPYDYYYYSEAQNAIKEASEHWEWKDDKLGSLASELESALGHKFGENRIITALKETERIVSEYERGPNSSRLDAEPGLDSGATVFMKQLGYEGVDVRHISEMDNTGYGSVIYDLKDEDLARKQEIGTARFSISDKEYLEAVRNMPSEDENYFGHWNAVRKIQPMVDQAAAEAGYTQKVYHGTDADPFTVFKTDYIAHGRNKGDGIYVTPLEEYAEEFGENVNAYYINPDRATYEDPLMYVMPSSNDIKSADPVTYDDSGNVIPLSERFNQENADIRFSLNEPVERVKDLIAVHNLKPDDIRNTFELGGFPMPSIAVTKDSMGHDMYGDITLMFHSDTIDPKKRRTNEVFGGDAYTPVFPRIHYKASSKVEKRLSDLYYEWSRKYGYDTVRPFYEYGQTLQDALDRAGGEAALIEQLKSDSNLMRMYLRINDNDVEDVMKITEITMPEGEVDLSKRLIDALGEEDIRSIVPEGVTGREALQYRREWVEAHKEKLEAVYRDYFTASGVLSEEDIEAVIPEIKPGEYAAAVRKALDYLRHGATTTKEEKDYKATTNAIKQAAEETGYDEWIDDLFKGVEEKRGLRNDRDMFTANGNRRKWESLYEPVTLDGVVRVMSQELSAGANGLLGANPKGASQKSYRSLDEIRADEDRLQQLPEEEFKALEEAAVQKLSDVCGDIVDSNSDAFQNRFGAVLDVGEYIAEILNVTKNRATIQRKLQSDYNLKVSDTQMDALMEAIDEIANLPTGYFEAKPRRAVGFDEVKAAIIPTSTDEDIKQGFSDRGIQMYEYDPDVEGDRTEKVNQAASENDLRFSISEDLDEPYMNAVNSGNMEEAQNLVDEAAQRAGYKARLYHGTQAFGFTQIMTTDLESTSDGEYFDWSPFFASDSLEVAQTYSASSEVRRISDDESPSNKAFESEYSDAVADAVSSINKFAGSDYTDISDNIFQTAYKKLKTETGTESYATLDLNGDVYQLIEEIARKKAEDRAASGNAKNTDDLVREIIYGEEAAPVWDAYEKARDMLNAYESGMYGVAGSGNYALFANTDNVMEIDAKGNKWNMIPANALTDITGEEQSMIDFVNTRTAAAYARDNGYDGIAISNLFDDGGKGKGMRQRTPATIYIFFQPERQVKSADPVTYAEDGSVIPLSERFDPNNDDIRYSMSTVDSDGNVLSDGQVDYFKDSQARDEQGRLVPVYHTTNKGGFTIFDPMRSDDHRSLFFASNWDVSQTYGNYANSRFYQFEINDLNDVEKYLDAYGPDFYVLTKDEFERAGGYEADFVDFENEGLQYRYDAIQKKWKSSNRPSETRTFLLNSYIEDVENGDINPADYVVIVGVPDYSPDHRSYSDTWILANSPNELVIELKNHFLAQQNTYSGSSTVGTQHGYYQCYLNLENPMIIDAKGQYWDSIKEDGFEQVSVLKIGSSFDVVADGTPISFSRVRELYGDAMADQIEEFDGWEPGEYHDFYTWNGAAFDPEEEGHWPMEGNTRFWAREAEAQGYDGVIFRNLLDIGGKSEFDGLNEYSDIYIAFNSNQVKDTRNTDPTNNPDIRYSLTEEDDIIAYASENAESTDELWYTDPELEEGRIRYSMSKQDFIEGKIRKWNPAWLTEGRVLEPKSVEKSIREVVMGAMAQSDTPARYRQALVKSLVVDAQKAFAYMKDGKESEAAALLYDSAHEMIESAKFFMDDDASSRYKELRDYFSNYKISIEEKYYSDIDIVTYRRNNMRNILIGRNGTMIDEIWEDLCDKWPEYFSMEVEHPVEMLEALEHAFEVAKPVAVAYSSEEAMDFAAEIADDLYDIVYEGKELVSLADKYQAKAKAMKQRHKEAMQDMKQKLKEARNETQRIKRESNIKLREQRVKHKNEIAALKQKQKDKDNKTKARKIRSHMINKLTDDYDWLVQRVLDPTKDKYVPEEFRKSLAEFLQMLDLQTEKSKQLEAKTGRVAQKTFKMRELKDRLENMAKTKNEDGVSMFELDSYVPYILESLTEKTEKYGGTIDSLDVSDVKEIGILMKAIRHNLDNYNKRIKAEKAEEISAIGENVVKDQLKRVEKRGAAKKYGGTRDTMDIINTAALTPAYFFDRLGPAMKSMYDELRYEGFDTYVRNEQLIIRRLNDILGKYHKQRKLNKNKPKPGSTIEEWRDDRSLHTIQLKANPEKTIKMTTAQIMSLYCLQKRNQALQHMLKGGIHITPIQSGSKIQQLKDREKGKIESAESVPLTIEDIQEIVAQLTPEQKQIADDLQQLMAVDMAKLGNEAHREMYGYEIFDDPNYFPIKSRSNEIATDVNNVGEVVEKIKSFGPAKPLDPKASNIIEVDDIFSVVADHCNGMNLYNAYLVPISDFVRVYNAKIMQEDGRSLSVKDALEMAHGKKAMTYINNFLRDINGIKSVQRGGLEDVMNKALGTAKRTAVFGNIRVALQQPTAIVRALAVMDPKHFVPFLKVKPQKGVREEMYRYCPIAQWKSWGFYDTYMGRDIEDVMMNNWSGMDVALSGIYGELDNWTWSLIWRAVKAEQAKAHPDMDTKSEEFLQMCGRRASEVFDRTQVVDSTFHRSDAMRSKQVAVKAFTAFMAEPTLTLNVFRAGIENAREEWLDGNKGKAMGTFNRAFSVIIMQAALVAAAQSFADAWRDKDPGWPGDGDDDDKEKESDYWTRWINNYVANLFDGLHLENNIYLVKDITPYFNFMISKAAEHGDWNPWLRAVMGWDQEYLFGESNLVMSALENTATGVSQIYKKIEKGDEYEKTWYDIIQKTVSGPSTFLGFPLGTLMRDTKPIWKNILGVTFADDGSAEMPKPSKQIEGVEDGSTVDNILNHFGINLSPAEQKAKADAERNEEIEKQIGKISDKASGLTGLDKDKKIWSAVTTYYKDDGHSLSSMVESGNFSEIYRMQSMYTRAGGDSEYFVERVMAESKKALKKSIIYDPTEEQIEAQRNVREYLLGHGMSEQELSDIVYKSDTAKEMKIAFRLNDKDAMMEELKPLVMAGLTYQDLERLWENRKRVNLKTYNGKYKDRLKSTGTYNWPISGQITSRFGHRASPGGIGSTNHQGLDIAGNMGDPVGAADGGTVIYSGWYGGAGKTVMIEHDDGTVTQYSHLSWYEAKVGDVVAQGQTIGNVGSTGNSTGPHLHFGVKVNGSYVDPLEYLNS